MLVSEKKRACENNRNFSYGQRSKCADLLNSYK